MSKPESSRWTPDLCVSDLPTSLEYYEHALGFDVSGKWSEKEACDEAARPAFACLHRKRDRPA